MAPFISRTTYDALNRPIELTTSRRQRHPPRYNEANLLNAIDVNLRGAAASTPSSRTSTTTPRDSARLIDYGNGVSDDVTSTTR